MLEVDFANLIDTGSKPQNRNPHSYYIFNEVHKSQKGLWGVSGGGGGGDLKRALERYIEKGRNRLKRNRPNNRVKSGLFIFMTDLIIEM